MTNPNFIYFVKNGKIECVEIPDFGSIIITSQNKKVMYTDITTRTKYTD